VTDYCTGLLLPGERTSVEPMAALTAAPSFACSVARTAPKHQSLLHFVANAPWSDAVVLSKVRQMVLPKIEALGAVEASIIDDTGFPKKGKHSVGVARQYCGQLGGGSQGSVHEVNGKLPEGSRTTARRWCQFRSPTATPACP
jgi:SRSO17 transposase